jgi:hypothetical protein
MPRAKSKTVVYKGSIILDILPSIVHTHIIDNIS